MNLTDGLTLTRIIRSSVNPNSKTIITALSAHAYKDHIDSCIEAGMNDFISKPVEREQFLNTLCKLLQQKQNQ
jgi:CheY-like chemotaxis protein